MCRHPGKMADLGTLAGKHKNSMARDVNNRVQVVGYSDTTPIALHFDLGGGALVRAAALHGRASAHLLRIHLGSLYESSHHAFLYDAQGGMLDLSQLPEVQAAGWSSLNYAYAINNRGEVIGSGTIGGKFHAFLLTPVTAPGR